MVDRHCPVAARDRHPPGAGHIGPPSRASSIQHCVWNLGQFTRSFQSAVALFDYSDRQFLDEITGTNGLPFKKERSPPG
jgi:hypothetical protein